jgi:hypothetical protein
MNTVEDWKMLNNQKPKKAVKAWSRNGLSAPKGCRERDATERYK